LASWSDGGVGRANDVDVGDWDIPHTTAESTRDTDTGTGDTGAEPADGRRGVVKLDVIPHQDYEGGYG
jgi:hypothetical protein